MENPSGGERPGDETPRPERPGTGGAVGGPGAEEPVGPGHGTDGSGPGETGRTRSDAPSVPAPPYPGPAAGSPPYRPVPPASGRTQVGAPHHPAPPLAQHGRPLPPDAGYGPPPAHAPNPWRGPAAQARPHPFALPPGGYPAAHPGSGWQQPAQPWPHPPERPSRRGASVLLGSAGAAVIALVALAASILIVATTPQEEPQPVGVDLTAHYDDRLRARPNQVEVDAVDHPLYDVAMPDPVDCDVPELDMASDESWEEFAAVSGDCLNTLWAPVFEDLGLSVELPEFAVTRVSPDSPDADPEEGYTLAYYESDLSRITIVLPNVRHLGALLPPGQREEVWLALMGHEYGHHVQYATGILGIAHGMTWKAEDERAELEAMRRTELQAECMAGVGLRGITGADEEALRTANDHFNGGGDLDTHGSASNRAFWLEQGWSQATVEGCNTYGATTDQVA
ncbi:neutral zinc metallopeptidase [Nocardiopsis alborubida]|uniref:Neutral zinc metallopeptidase n=1 Tax=Nocardiopsis alborubida TaxID=146802 RepID=A0A7X6MI69_9ACTN|nr:neutral zinc metallopeptidase [Nocardiopsis alborubida]NKZ00199.1 hypothetical protein [Nocardiopsis alborubida]